MVYFVLKITNHLILFLLHFYTPQKGIDFKPTPYTFCWSKMAFENPEILYTALVIKQSGLLRNPQSQWRVSSWANHRTGDWAAARHVDTGGKNDLTLWETWKQKTNWKDPPCYFHGKINYFDWAMASIANCWHNQRVTPQNGDFFHEISGPPPGPAMFLHGFPFTTWIQAGPFTRWNSLKKAIAMESFEGRLV